MTTGVRLQQLYILRAQVDMLIAMEESVVLPDSTPPNCEHPEEKRVQSNNIGESAEFFCQACKQFVKGTA